MKKTALFLTLTAGIAFNSAVLAGGFNQRGEDFIATVQSGSGVSTRSAIVIPRGFNQRGVDYIADAPAGSNTPGGKVYITSSGFNDRGFGSIN